RPASGLRVKQAARLTDSCRARPFTRSGDAPAPVRLGVPGEFVSSRAMARHEIEEFLRDFPRETALALTSLLEDEVQAQDSLVIVRCGTELSLLRYTEAGDILRFYFVRES